MLDATSIFIAAVFTLAGFVKGVIGLGLPTISMGLLAIVMTPLEAAAILVLPSFLTNVWQMAAGPSLNSIVQRLWPMMVSVCLGTWAGAGLMIGTHARYGMVLLGVALLIYAVTGLASLRLSIDKVHERWLGPAVGGVTGVITAATGVFVIPAVPYLQAIQPWHKPGPATSNRHRRPSQADGLGRNCWVPSATSVYCAGRRTTPSGTTPSRTSRHNRFSSAP
jgi:uncharacterized protein